MPSFEEGKTNIKSISRVEEGHAIVLWQRKDCKWGARDSLVIRRSPRLSMGARALSRERKSVRVRFQFVAVTTAATSSSACGAGARNPCEGK